MIGTSFPQIDARSLEGRAFRIPRDLGGTANVIVLAFLREHQQPVEEWLPHLALLREENPGVEVWEVPALPRRYRIWRSAIDGGMRAGIDDPGVRAHTLTAYLDLGELKRSLGLPGLEVVRIYLLDRDGRVRWQGSGGFNEAVLASLKAALQEV